MTFEEVVKFLEKKGVKVTGIGKRTSFDCQYQDYFLDGPDISAIRIYENGYMSAYPSYEGYRKFYDFKGNRISPSDKGELIYEQNQIPCPNKCPVYQMKRENGLWKCTKCGLTFQNNGKLTAESKQDYLKNKE